MERERRHTHDHPCPVCTGHAGLSAGRGVRCAGFTLDRVVFCTREQHAGSLPIDISTAPPTYHHRMFGDCGCGTQHGWAAVTAMEALFRPQPYVDIEDHDRAYRHLLARLRYNLPSDFAKLTDTRRATFVAKYGDVAVELNALPISVLRERLIEEVEEHMDLEALAEVRVSEQSERERLVAVLRSIA